MKKQKIPRSVAKYIRKEKGRIRKTVPDQIEQARLFVALYDRFALK